MTSLVLTALLTTPMLQITIYPDRTRQTIDNFAASDSWTVEPLIRWPESSRKKIADLLFDQKKGAGLSGWRFNLGGGINHETINNPLRTVDTFETGPGTYDWSRCPGQTWMLRAAKEHGVETVITYAVTPPARLTRNGKTNGTDKEGTTNLQPGKEPDYARYLCDIVEHFRGEGVPIRTISPINEPDIDWNAGSQEGNRASNTDILSITNALHDEIERRQMSLRILTPEANSIGVCLGKSWIGGKYKADYGEYAALFEKEEAWRKKVRPIFAYHDYGSDGWDGLLDQRRKLRAAFDKIPDQEIWETEYCQMNGPRGEGGWGRDIGMTLTLNVARLIHLDMSVVETSAWQWWLGVSDSDYKDGLIYVDDLDKSDGTVFPSKTLWALGNFSRFVRPGYQRVEIKEPQENLGGVMATAYKDPKSGQVAVVFVNCGGSSEDVTVSLAGYEQGVPYITSDRPGDDLRKLSAVPLAKPFRVPSRSVMTLVCARNGRS